VTDLNSGNLHRLKENQNCLTFGTSPVAIFVLRTDVLTKEVRGFPQSLHVNTKIHPRNKEPQLHPSYFTFANQKQPMTSTAYNCSYYCVVKQSTMSTRTETNCWSCYTKPPRIVRIGKNPRCRKRLLGNLHFKFRRNFSV
jgi:hypothetical protein